MSAAAIIGREGRLDLGWTAPGPVSEAFMACRGPRIQILNGPVGSGKTTTCMMKAVDLAFDQLPSPRRHVKVDGVLRPARLFRVTIVRTDYPGLWRTTIPSWQEQFPLTHFKGWTGGQGGPAKHLINFRLPDGSVLLFEALFVAIGENTDIKSFMAGFPTTIWYLNEVDTQPEDIAEIAFVRAGRFPGMADGGPSVKCVLADLNAPVMNNWTYEEYFTKSPAELAAKGVALFRQPSGLSPQAENLANLPPNYYRDQMQGGSAWLISLQVKNKPGYSRSGLPVYAEFNDELHVAPVELVFDPRLPLTFGLDAGGHPAAVVCQRRPNGQRLVLAEIVFEKGSGPSRAGRDFKEFLAYTFPGAIIAGGYCDPSAQYGADTKDGELSWIQKFAEASGFTVLPAPTNDWTLRYESVNERLTAPLLEGAPRIQISPRCAKLRAGFNAGYHFRKRKVPGVAQYEDRPEKNHPYSDLHDALQYDCLGDGGYLEVLPGLLHGGVGTAIAASFDPYNDAPAADAVSDDTRARMNAYLATSLGQGR